MTVVGSQNPESVQSRKEVISMSRSKKQTAPEMISHLWKRCRHMESGDYFFFKQLHKVTNWYHKDLSEKQEEILVGYMTKYGSMKETPKPKGKKKLNPHA